jgi:altronate hydrolase
MLFDIQKLPTMENSALRLHPRDNIAIARVPLDAGAELVVDGLRFVTADPIPKGHKVSLREIRAGETVERYGQAIGRARMNIAPGKHVHTHNLAFEELEQAYEFPGENASAADTKPAPAPLFQGYMREDGRVGTRNYIAVVAASNCAAHTAELIAHSYDTETLPANVDGIIAFPHGEGCGHAFGPDVDQLRRTLGGVLVHPNVSAALILGLGCEVNQMDFYLGNPAGRVAGLTLQSSGGTRATVDAARREIAGFIERAAEEHRADAPASRIVLGLQCGGSDSFSGITANPALGYCSDLLAEIGGTAVLAETPEIVGAEHLLVKRARNRAVAEKLLACISGYKRYLNRFEGSFDDNPTPGNKAGGLTTILEKSLGAAAKGGTSTLMDVYEYAERVTSPGFVFMNTPGYDPPSMAGEAAGGCNMFAFTTGRGSATGFPTVPVIKISTNTDTFRRMPDDMDINAGRIADGESTLEAMGREIFNMMLEVASGRRTCSERLGHREFVPWRIGPVL